MTPDSGPKPFASYLQQAPGLVTIQQKTQQLQRVNQLLALLLPPPLPLYCRVANYRQGIIIVETSSGSWLLRLRYEQMNLITALRQQLLPALVTIEFVVNPQLAYRQSDSRHQRSTHSVPAAKVITPCTAQKLQQLAEFAPAGLRNILLQLAMQAHHLPADRSMMKIPFDD
ncbi:MAG: DUF721 domain-containing protein [Candidatus Symbiodolus clandestinus]